MPKFKLTAASERETITFVFEHEYLDDVLENFDRFLRGVGFFPDGDHLEYVSYEQEKSNSLDEWTRIRREDAEGREFHSEYYFDIERNK